MFTPPIASATQVRGLPLGFPDALWSQMSEEHRSACESAEKLIGGFDADRSLDLREASRRAGLSIPQALEGLSVLDGMSLVDVEASTRGPRITLLAVPEEHVRIVGPDGQERWVFVARPLDPPSIDPKELN